MTPRDSGPVRLNLPVFSPVLPVCHDDAGWCAEFSAFEHSAVISRLALTTRGTSCSVVMRPSKHWPGYEMAGQVDRD